MRGMPEVEFFSSRDSFSSAFCISCGVEGGSRPGSELVVGLGFALEWIMGGRLSGIFSCGWHNLDFAWTLMSEGQAFFFLSNVSDILLDVLSLTSYYLASHAIMPTRMVSSFVYS
jgi:hypothetical protein